MNDSTSRELIERAERVMPGGVSGADRILDPNLIFTEAQGAYVTDADGRRYLDFHCAYGSVILGHCHPEVTNRVDAVMRKLDLTSVGTHELEIELAEKIVQYLPSAQKVLFCNSGSEATYAAIRLARAATGRPKIVKFQGCYHGWHDAVLVNVYTPPERLGHKDPESLGMTPQVVEDTFVLPLNDKEEAGRLLQERVNEIAAVIIEPIPHFLGCILPDHDYLKYLRRLTSLYGIVLIFDEVISGFRHGLGGYQAIAGVIPDLTTVGKAIANGYPLAALCGRADLMELYGRDGPAMFSGTFNGHPVAVAAGLATVEILERPGVYEHLFALGERMRRGLTEIVKDYGVEAVVSGFGSIWVLYFMAPPPRHYGDLLRNDASKFLHYRRKMIEHGIYELPRYLKRSHLCLAHTAADVDRNLEVADLILRDLA